MNENAVYRADGTELPLDLNGVHLLMEADRLPSGLWNVTRYNLWGEVIENEE